MPLAQAAWLLQNKDSNLQERRKGTVLGQKSLGKSRSDQSSRKAAQLVRCPLVYAAAEWRVPLGEVALKGGWLKWWVGAAGRTYQKRSR